MARQIRRNINRSPLAYASVIVLVIVILILAYFVASTNANAHAKKQAAFNIVNLSNSTLNRTQLTLLGSLQKSFSLNSFHVTYVSRTTRRTVQESSSFALELTSNQTVDSYHNGSYNLTIYRNITTYADAATGSFLGKNVSSTYYNSAASALLCENTTTTNSTGGTKTSISCANGDVHQPLYVMFPFYAKNVSSFGLLIIEGNITNAGVETFAGRQCDNYVFSNVTHFNILSSYEVMDLCLDTQYGIPLYVNDTHIINGKPTSVMAWTATNFTTNVPANDFAVPPQYSSGSGT